MAVALRGVGTPATTRSGSGSASISITPNLPDGWQPGDTSVLIIDYSSATPVAPDGWDEVVTFKAFPYHGIFTRRLEAGDTAPVITYANPLNFASLGGVHMVFSGVNAVRPPTESVSQNTRGSTAQGGPITTTYAGEAALNIAFSLAAGWGTPSGWSALVAYRDNVYANDNYGVSASYLIVDQPGTVTPPVISNDASSSSVLVNFALLPAPAPGDPITGRGNTQEAADAASGTGAAPLVGSGTITGNKDVLDGIAAVPGFRGVGTAATASTTTTAGSRSILPSLPPAYKAGDLAILMVAVGRNTAAALAAPEGWTLLASDTFAGSTRSANVYLFYRFLEEVDSAPMVTLTLPTNTVMVGRIAAYAGYRAAGLIESITATDDTVGSGNPINCPAVTTTAPYDTVLQFAFYNQSTTCTPPSGWVERIDNGGNSGTTSHVQLYLMDRTFAATGTAPAANITPASTAGDRAKIITVVLSQPAPTVVDQPTAQPTFFVNQGGVWKSVQSLWVNQGGTWRQVQQLHANSAGTWKRVL